MIPKYHVTCVKNIMHKTIDCCGNQLLHVGNGLRVFKIQKYDCWVGGNQLPSYGKRLPREMMQFFLKIYGIFLYLCIYLYMYIKHHTFEKEITTFTFSFTQFKYHFQISFFKMV